MMYNENVNDSTNDSTNDSVLDRYPDISSNPVVPVELKETVGLLLEAFDDAVAYVSKSGSKSVQRRRIFILYYISQDPDTRPSRSDLAATLSVSVSTVDKTLEFCRKILGDKCLEHGLPPTAFENLINSRLL